MIRRPPRSTLTHSFPTRRSSDLLSAYRHGRYRRALGGAARSRAARRCAGQGAAEAALPDPACLAMHHGLAGGEALRSEEHTSELQSLMRISYAVFCFTNTN